MPRDCRVAAAHRGPSPRQQRRIMMDKGFDCEPAVKEQALAAMQFSLLIQGAPAASDAPVAALKFAQAAVAAGHRVHRAFFHGEGASIASAGAAPPEDETDVAQAWADFAQRHDISLVACVASAARRGVATGDAASKPGASALRDGFDIGGLGQMIEAMNAADRTVTFGA